MKRKSPFWIISIAAVLLVGLIINQIFWVYTSANQQEEQFNKQIEMAMTSIGDNIEEYWELQESVDCCLIEDENSSCKMSMSSDMVWMRTDKMIEEELQRFDIDLNYNFDICFKDNVKEIEGYEQSMDKVFEKSGIVLYLDFPDKSKYLRNQIGPVFISSILLIVFLSIVFVMTYRYYKRERDFSQRTRDFINNMTHEFKTPLTNISLANKMITSGLGSVKDEKLLHFASIIDDENQRLNKNCDDLLQMASIENSQVAFTELIDVHEILKEVIAVKKKTKIQQSLTIAGDLKANKWKVLGKESLFFNTISNLLDNAIKYADKPLEIVVSTENKGDMLQLKIQDNGMGMKEEHIDNIFDKFYRITEKDTHDVKGFGLGLAYVKMVINRMKGSIKVESKLGLGTTFSIIIPTSSNA
jgi:two-component system phosphate regulon sensor histidine kinase PhoR